MSSTDSPTLDPPSTVVPVEESNETRTTPANEGGGAVVTPAAAAHTASSIPAESAVAQVETHFSHSH